MTKRAGIDFSLTSPAVCVGIDGGPHVLHSFRASKKQKSTHPDIILYDYPEWSHQQERLEKLALWVFDIVKDCDSIQIEGYSMGSKGRVFDIAEGTELVKYFLWKHGKDLLLIPPTTAKQFATGKGNATKNLMVLAYNKEEYTLDVFGALGKIFDPANKKVASPMGDLIDSYWMWKYREPI